MNDIPQLSTDSEELRKRFMDPCRLGSETDWWARRHIEELERERDALLADNARLRTALETISALGILHMVNGSPHWIFPLSVKNRAEEALAATPAQSLARLRNQVRDECAIAGGPEDSYQDEWFKAKADSAARILATKEPE